MKTLLLLLFITVFATELRSQDTLRVSLQEFVERGLEKSGQIAYEEGAVRLAENRVNQARSTRILPNINLDTNHGLVPGVVSRDDNLPESQYYLDPNLENDWEDWAIFTRAEISAVQPVYTWGAINKAVSAAEAGARAAEERFIAARGDVELQLVELYYSYLLSMEISAIVNEAESQINQVDRVIEEMREEEDPGLREKDVFQFEIYRSEFQVQKLEVEQGAERIRRVWSYILSDGEAEVVWMPAEEFLDPVPVQLEPFEVYLRSAFVQRPEMRGIEAGMEAYRLSADATRAQNFPMLYLGLTASFANTPNRPRQSNPFIINNTNFATAAVGLGIRQNLNFSALRNRTERAEIEYNRARHLRDAFTDQITLELNEHYAEAVVAEERVSRTNESLTTARNWVRHEQLNYDFGFGEMEDMVEAVRTELELRVDLKRQMYELNRKMAQLYKTAGLSVTGIAQP
ncbi:MAG: TolC family protein [Balneolaceae bacterium]